MCYCLQICDSVVNTKVMRLVFGQYHCCPIINRSVPLIMYYGVPLLLFTHKLHFLHTF